MKQVNPRAPVAKVRAAGAGGALSVIIVWILDAVGVDVPPEVAAAGATLLAFGAGYLRSPESGAS